MTKFSPPPGPKSNFFGLDLVARITRDPLSFYDQMRRQYGDVVYMRLGTFHDFTIFHPDAIHELLTTKAKAFTRMKRQMDVFRQWNGNSVVVTEGSEWLRQRRVLQPAFSPKRFENYGQAIVNTANDYFDRCLPGAEAEIDMERAMIELTTAVICSTMFGGRVDHLLVDIRKAVTTISQAAYREMLRPFSLPMWIPTPSNRRKRWAIAFLDQIVRTFIRERRAEGADAGDLLSMMLLAVNEEGDGKGLTDEEVRDNCLTIFLAGHDTTAAGVTWLMWFLASRPQFAQRAREEVQAVVGDRPLEFADVARLTFLDQMISETLRHRPPAIAVFGRQAVEDVELAGYRLPAGSLVHVLSYTVHHDERWFADPQNFDPDRFSPEREGQLRPYAYFPFGMGPRTCIGNTFAKMEMALIAAELLRRYELSPAPGQKEPEPLSDVTLRPQGGVRLLVKRLRPPG